MTQFVRNGGYWTIDVIREWCKTKTTDRVGHLIQLSLFEDNQLYIQDGHHRIASTFAGGRKELRHDEFEVSLWRYSDYLEINPALDWFTPFDPRTEIRLPDIASFKNKARDLFVIDEQEAIKFIRNNKSLYAVPRKIFGIVEMCESLKEWTS